MGRYASIKSVFERAMYRSLLRWAASGIEELEHEVNEAYSSQRPNLVHREPTGGIGGPVIKCCAELTIELDHFVDDTQHMTRRSGYRLGSIEPSRKDAEHLAYTHLEPSLLLQLADHRVPRVLTP